MKKIAFSSTKANRRAFFLERITHFYHEDYIGASVVCTLLAPVRSEGRSIEHRTCVKGIDKSVLEPPGNRIIVK